ncbi:hypothetical protein DFJ73DRAFT_866162 [Zopfochytrium polystomum]|nr:hypothetical protein DFJ73DRAFT_866162 [Zopfochytrium polystomum]
MSSQQIADSNMMVAMSLSVFTIVVCYWDTIAKIKDQALFWSIILAVVGHLEHTIASTLSTLDLSRDFDYDKLMIRTMWTSCGDILAMSSLLFHTVYRTMLTLHPTSNRLWFLPTKRDL